LYSFFYVPYNLPFTRHPSIQWYRAKQLKDSLDGSSSQKSNNQTNQTKPTNHPTNQPNNQPVKQPTNQPSNQPNSKRSTEKVSRVNEVFTTKSELSLSQPNASKTTAVTMIFQQLDISN
jgi:hypothetical protein